MTRCSYGARQSAPAGTWAALRESLPGLSDDVLEIVRRVTAPERHAARVRAVALAVLDATALAEVEETPGGGYTSHRADGTMREYASYGQACEASVRYEDRVALEGYLIRGERVLTRGHDWAARAAQLCRLELHGRGGYFGAGGDSRATERMPWAAALGKGRRHATDGAAWDAAIEEVAARLEQAISLATDAASERDRIRNLVDGWLGTEDAPWVESLILHRVVTLVTAQQPDWAAAVREWDGLLRFVRSVDGLGAGGES